MLALGLVLVHQAGTLSGIGVYLVQHLLKDLKHSARLLVRAPGFALSAIVAVALGIAANATVFSVVNAVLLKPLSYRDPKRIVMFQNTFPAGRSGSAAPAEFNWWRQQTQLFQDVSAYDFGVANWTDESMPEQTPTMHVSADFFRLCGTTAIQGRTFTATDDSPNAPKTVVLAYGFWQRRFAGDPHVIGKYMTLSGDRYEIIGVAAASPHGGQIAEQSLLSGDIEISEPPDVYLPFQLDPLSPDQGHYFNVAGRLKPGVTQAAVSAALQASYAGFARKWPGVDTPGRGFGIQPLQDAIVGGVRSSLLILLGAVGLVLLIACANLANLLLVRAMDRKREIAIRAAVGAGRTRIIRQLLTENMMLSMLGGVVGAIAGFAGIRAILRFLPDNIPRIGSAGSNVELDWRVLGFTIGLSLLTGILFGLVPALQASRADLNSTLKESGSRSGTGMRHNHTRAVLVATEMGLAVMLLVGAALLIRSFLVIRQVNPGFDAHNVLAVRVSLTGPQFVRPERMSDVIREGVRRIRAIPGVEMAATTCCVPLEDHLHGAFQIAGRPEGPNSGGFMGWARISPGYFETLRIPVLRGRTFSAQDENGPPVVMISQALAKQFWPNGDPLKDQITFTGDPSPRQIVGIVGDVREEAITRSPRPYLYLLSAQMTNTGLMTRIPWAWVIRTRAEPLSLRSAIQKELREATGGLPVAQLRTMEENVSRSSAVENLEALVLTIFGCAALLLAAMGIYGVLAYSVAQRTHEIGIRLALGADSRRIQEMVIVQGLRPALAGMICGLATSFGSARLMAGFLFGVNPWDPLVFLLVPSILAGVALMAVWIPAARASRLDPVPALRCE